MTSEFMRLSEPAHVADVTVNGFIGLGDGRTNIPMTHSELDTFLKFQCAVPFEVVDKYQDATKRDKLIGVIGTVDDQQRTKIVRGVLTWELYDHDQGEDVRNTARAALEQWLSQNEGGVEAISVPLPTDSVPDEVRNILDHFEDLEAKYGVDDAFDRLHSAFHEFLRYIHRRTIGDPGHRNIASLLTRILKEIDDEMDPHKTIRDIGQALLKGAAVVDGLRRGPAHGALNRRDGEVARNMVATVFAALAGLDWPE